MNEEIDTQLLRAEMLVMKEMLKAFEMKLERFEKDNTLMHNELNLTRQSLSMCMAILKDKK